MIAKLLSKDVLKSIAVQYSSDSAWFPNSFRKTLWDPSLYRVLQTSSQATSVPDPIERRSENYYCIEKFRSTVSPKRPSKAALISIILQHSSDPSWVPNSYGKTGWNPSSYSMFQTPRNFRPPVDGRAEIHHCTIEMRPHVRPKLISKDSKDALYSIVHCLLVANSCRKTRWNPCHSLLTLACSCHKNVGSQKCGLLLSSVPVMRGFKIWRYCSASRTTALFRWRGDFVDALGKLSYAAGENLAKNGAA